MRLDSVESLKRSLRSSVNTDVGGLSSDKHAVAYFTPGLTAPTSHAPPTRQLGVSLGIALGKGPDDYRLAVRLTRYDAPTRSYVDTLSLQASGEIDVQVVGEIQADRPLPSTATTPWRSLQRPLVPGCSVAHVDVTAGTIGGFVELPDGSQRMLSNNHVLANSDAGSVGDLILQPGPADDGTHPPHAVARLQEFIPLQGSNIDAALAPLLPNVKFECRYGNRTLTGVGPASPNMEVFKIGRTTGFTKGSVRAIAVDDVRVRYGNRVIFFDDQIEIEGDGGPFSRGGDSGSLIFNASGAGVGLLFAGSDTGGASGHGFTYANQLGQVLRRFSAQLIV
ncbi:hypothetical protein [Polyangium mundeleinium]|uniref:Serine protease n=1 Tax=Polyangium mundeleinium TaxID=2995306 RepID=A0ABT5F054_9BACT|nr:hypothetical protein [Polyangium mundeleinium]MDC0746547.1 hypothetical protein [Polyangium mundeleinium]